MRTQVTRDGIYRLGLVGGIAHTCGDPVSKDTDDGEEPSRALNAGSMLPPDATRTASMTLSSTLGNASLSVALASSFGLSGRGGTAGEGATVVVAMGAAVGVGSRLLSSEGFSC